MLLPGADGGNFRKSYLWRPSSTIAYGDKEVRHRKMEGSVDPFFDDDPPWPWSFDSGIEDLGPSPDYPYYHHRYRYYGWYSGSSYSESYGACWQADPATPTKPYHFYVPPAKWRARIVDNLYLDFWYARNPNDTHDIYDLPDFSEDEWARIGARYNIYGQVDPKGQWRCDYYAVKTVSYKILSPLPYYWIDYMDSIRPHSKSDEGALSECIRNVITENTTFNTNSYANLIEIIDTIVDFRNGKIEELLEDSKNYYRIIKDTVGDISGKNLRCLTKSTSKKAASAWLQYRYAYNTTKSDIEQFARMKFGEYLGALSPDRVLRGSIAITGGQLRVKMRLHDDTSNILDSMLISLNQYGLMPGLYNVWDMIPFSFISDWFSSLGDHLQDIDERFYFRYYKVDELLVSYKQSLVRDEFWGSTRYMWYDRILLDSMPNWEIYEEEGGTKTKTVVKRVLDGFSIIVGII
jgi:hypothetical protein